MPEGQQSIGTAMQFLPEVGDTLSVPGLDAVAGILDIVELAVPPERPFRIQGVRINDLQSGEARGSQQLAPDRKHHRK